MKSVVGAASLILSTAPQTMTQISPALRRCAKSFSLVFTFAVSVTALAAQDTPARTPADTAPPDVVELEEFRVSTGTHIRRDFDPETVLPITVLDFTDLEAIDASTAIELFESLPETGFSEINETATLGADARGDVASVNLRGIGVGNTLVLLNGRRIPAHPISQNVGTVPTLTANVNSLPTAIVERVEVLRDGASAIYGADAVAGVINTITRTDYNRTSMSLRIQRPEQPGADEESLTLSRGVTFNEGRSFFAWSYARSTRDVLMRTDRAFAIDSDMRPQAPPPWTGELNTYIDPATGNPTTYRDNDWDNRSSISGYGHWIIGSFIADGSFVGRRPTTGINTSTLSAGGLQARVSSSSGGFYLTPVAETDANGFNIGFKSDNNAPVSTLGDPQSPYWYNTNPYHHILPEVTRDTLYAVWSHKFNNGIEAFGDLLGYHSQSVSYRAPISADSTDDPQIYVPAQNPWNPFGVRFYHPTGQPNADGSPRNTGTPSDVLMSPGRGVRLIDHGGRRIEVKSRSGRAVVGLRGRVLDTWDWESGLNYGFAKTQDKEPGIRESRLREALARTDDSAYNPFHHTFRLDQVTTTGTNQYRIYVDGTYTNPQTVLDEVTDTFERIGRTSLFTWDLKANGDIIRNWAGTIQGAAGLEYRYESYADWRPPYAGLNPPEAIAARPDLFRPDDNDFIAISPNANIDVSRNVMSVFGEVLIPLTSPRMNLPLLRSLELSMAARYETFSMFGDTLKPKFGVNWRPNRWLLVRGSYSESFLAPNLVQTNPDPVQRNASGIIDYYRSGIPGATDAASRTRKVFRGGNPDLEPEEAEAGLIGIAIEPPFLKNVSFGIDYYRIKMINVIDAPTSTSQSQLDADMLAAAAAAQIAAGVPLAQLSAFGPGGEYLGNPNVFRFAPTPEDSAAFLSYNQNLPAGEMPRVPVGQLNYFVNDYKNLNSRDISGYDIRVRWRPERTRLGRFTVRARASYLASFDDQEETVNGNVALFDRRWKDNRPKWNGNMALTWRFANVTAGFSAYYIGSRLETSAIMGVSTSTPENMDARYAALGYPNYLVRTALPSGAIRYYYKVPSYLYYNTYVSYRFRQREGWLRDTTLRVGILNLAGREPPIADLTQGYRGGTSLARGRTFNASINKRF